MKAFYILIFIAAFSISIVFADGCYTPVIINDNDSVTLHCKLGEKDCKICMQCAEKSFEAAQQQHFSIGGDYYFVPVVPE